MRVMRGAVGAGGIECEIDFRRCNSGPKGAMAFFKEFSRFEYALKAGGYVRAGNGDGAEVKWVDFARALDMAVGGAGFLDRVAGTARTLVGHPPRKQVFLNGRLAYRDAPAGPVRSTQDLFVMVRRVRNNLFHGGKQGGPNDGIADRNRDAKLIADARSVLHEALRYERQVRIVFEGRG